LIDFIRDLNAGVAAARSPGAWHRSEVAVLAKAFTPLVDDLEFQEAADSVRQVEFN
jgi:hypothetical protein